MDCPLCKKNMKQSQYESVQIDTCPSCNGVWLDQDELGKIVTTQEETFTIDAVKKTLDETKSEKVKRDELMRYIMSFKKGQSLPNLKADDILAAFRQRWGSNRSVECPKCSAGMEEFEYAGTGIMLDRCPNKHGFWLDEGELDKVQIMMEYYQKITGPKSAPAQTKPTEKKCPLCREKLYEKEYEGVPIDICSTCSGVWLDKGELYEIIKKREETFSEAEKAQVQPESAQTASQSALMPECHCPSCGALMKRFVYVGISGIVIDSCSAGCGIWLDKGELEKVQIYVEKSEELAKDNKGKYSRILTQAKLDAEERYDAMIKRIKVSRFGAVNSLMQWMARKMD